ncbi:MAG: hypothetical protein AVDCRST_MAG19-3197 [uncultured Thermomicrobiales bacterium]|uniref:Uncharacterized protein n=1 Tax=uncultured Thermomicrobiales bacterium TaxID=1645740 RepID=A0A6J4VC22_9BACT|nr:MAG: hypothetical protein AVDCRST_MAG19-3197 [uncultured Thermomicrobiales bacterium]
MGERPNPGDCFEEHDDRQNPPGMGAWGAPVERYDGGFRYRGTWDKDPEGVGRVRLFHRGNETPVLLLSKLPENASTAVTNMVEILAAEAIRHHCPKRFELAEPAIVLEYAPAEHNT